MCVLRSVACVCARAFLAACLFSHRSPSPPADEPALHREGGHKRARRTQREPTLFDGECPALLCVLSGFSFGLLRRVRTPCRVDIGHGDRRRSVLAASDGVEVVGSRFLVSFVRCDPNALCRCIAAADVVGAMLYSCRVRERERDRRDGSLREAAVARGAAKNGFTAGKAGLLFSAALASSARSSVTAKAGERTNSAGHGCEEGFCARAEGKRQGRETTFCRSP